jgi:Tol biopolymer transport system component
MALRRTVLLAAIVALLSGVLMGVSLSPASATFPGKNGLILFNRGGDLYTATASGSSLKRMTSTGGISGAKWSPDGKRIAYRRGGNLLVRTVATGRTITVAIGVASAPQWSPDGARVAYLAKLPDKWCEEQGIFSVPSTGGAAPRLDYNPTVATGDSNCEHGTFIYGLGTYLPGGQSILLTTCYGWHDEDCWLVEASVDGWNGSPRGIYGISCTQEDAYPEDGSPAKCSYALHLSEARIGPGGNGVLFSGKGGNPPLPGSSASPTLSTPERIYAIDKSGSGLHQVSTATSGHSPTWSPDGSTVLFTQKSGTGNNLLKVTGTSSTVRATVLIKNASQADWQPVP